MDQEQRMIAPYGIALPFLWTIASFGELPIERKRIEIKKQGLFGMIFGKAGSQGEVVTSYVPCTMEDLYE